MAHHEPQPIGSECEPWERRVDFSELKEFARLYEIPLSFFWMICPPCPNPAAHSSSKSMLFALTPIEWGLELRFSATDFLGYRDGNEMIEWDSLFLGHGICRLPERLGKTQGELSWMTGLIWAQESPLIAQDSEKK
jgi:hypothetical protein